jgi:hypothetical protein
MYLNLFNTKDGRKEGVSNKDVTNEKRWDINTEERKDKGKGAEKGYWKVRKRDNNEDNK